MSGPNPLTVAVVHYRSGGSIGALLRDLARQDHPRLEVFVVECGDDGSVADAARRGFKGRLIQPHANLGYCGGNNRVFEARSTGSDVLVVNPDVRLVDTSVVRRLHEALMRAPDLAAVGPAITTPRGAIEHADSVIDMSRGLAVHARTHLREWPSDLGREIHHVPWLDGACWLLRSSALDALGGFDERYFLYCEEVDWSLRATVAGWKLGIDPSATAMHDRSSSFVGTDKGAYYYWRNNYLLFREHSDSQRWRKYWATRVLRFAASRTQMRTRGSRFALRGARDALLGRYGPMPGESDV